MSPANRSRHLWHRGSFYVLNALLIAAIWWTLSRLLLGGSISVLAVGEVAASVLVWLMAAVIGLLLMRGLEHWVFYLSSGVGAFSVLLFFSSTGIAVLAALSFFVGVLLMRFRFHLEEKYATRILFRRILPRALPPFFTFSALAVALLYFASPVVEQGINLTVPRPVFDVIIESLPLGQQLPAVGISQDQLYEQVNQQVQSVIEPYRSVLPLFFVLGVALTLKALSYPLIWLLVVFESGLLRLLLRTGVVEKDQKSVEKEVFTF